MATVGLWNKMNKSLYTGIYIIRKVLFLGHTSFEVYLDISDIFNCSKLGPDSLIWGLKWYWKIVSFSIVFCQPRPQGFLYSWREMMMPKKAGTLESF